MWKMNGTASRALVLGYGGCKPPFTALQWQELEKQTMIYKYLMAGLPVPPDLLRPIPYRFEELPARSALGCLSYYGKKIDPEPGRCRRTDGKKWRCSKAAYSESKYCERHMYRNRSRKHVESQPTSKFSSSAMSKLRSEESSCWSNVTKLQMGPVSYGIHNSESSFMPTPDPNELSFSQEASTTVGRSIQESFSRLQGNSSAKQYMPQGFEPINASFGSDHAGSPAAAKQGDNPVHHFFSGPATTEAWCNLDDDRSNHNVSYSTQLSISIPRASSDLPITKNSEYRKRDL